MATPSPSFRRHMPCSMAIDVRPFRLPGVSQVTFTLGLDSFGWTLKVDALVAQELIERAASPDDFLTGVGRDAIGRALGAMQNLSNPAWPAVPTSSFPKPEPPPVPPSSFVLSQSDKEILRGYKILPE